MNMHLKFLLGSGLQVRLVHKQLVFFSPCLLHLFSSEYTLRTYIKCVNKKTKRTNNPPNKYYPRTTCSNLMHTHTHTHTLTWLTNKIKVISCDFYLTLPLPRVINFNFLFQSLTRDISYSMENLAIDSLLR